MTWISRLLPDHSSLRRRATRDHQDRTARARRRRRDMSLESLEARLVMTGEVQILNPVQLLGGPLTLTGDTGGDNIPIRVNPGGTVTIGPTFLSIGGGPGSLTTITTFAPTTSIDIELPGGGNSPNPNFVTITGPGKFVPTSLQSINVNSPSNGAQPAHPLSVTITGVTVSGFLNIEQLGRATPVLGGQLTATVLNSSFGSLEIEQEGCCPAVVTLGGDTVFGLAEVYEGFANGDQILLEGGDSFGSTILQQWTQPLDGDPVAPPPPANNPTYYGTHDLINVSPTTAFPGVNTVQDLTIVQGGIGGDQQVVVDHLNVSANSFGVSVTQTGGAQNGNNGGGPAAYAVVCDVNLIPGQHPNFPVFGIPFPAPGVTITQSTPTATGGAGGNYADVANVILPGNITINQLSDGGNYAEILGSIIGLGFFLGPYWQEFPGTGNATINQPGNGSNRAVIDRDTFNNLDVDQGDNTSFGNCFGQTPGDVIMVNDTFVYSDMELDQGTSDALNGGSNTIAIGTTVPNTDPGTTIAWRSPVDAHCFDNIAPSPVTAFDTDIHQFGPDNFLYLGAYAGGPAPVLDANGFAFTTTYLDAYTGSGGATTYAAYVDVLGGADDSFDIEGFNAGFNIWGAPGSFNVLFIGITAGGAPTNGGFGVVADPGSYFTTTFVT